MKKSFILIFLLTAWFSSWGRQVLSEINGESVDLSGYQIVIPLSSSVHEIKAASELQKYLKLITGNSLPVVDESAKLTTREFIIGATNRGQPVSGVTDLNPDGFQLITAAGRVFIRGGAHKGALYGVYELLEKHLGCRFLTPDVEYIPDSRTIVIPALNVVSNPAFNSREVYYAGMDEQDFADKMRCDRHAWRGGEDWGLWVHTTFRLVPPETYFQTHPEYYALMAGKRTTTQLCLTNPEVFNITTEALRKLMAEHPEKKYWSVSQMDNYGACECENCRAIDDHEGTKAGSVIWFVNRIAGVFPDKVISTLAYQYTRKAPAYLKPAPNVNIMLCTIECDRSKPLQADTMPGAFIHDLKAWSAISDDILIWDYVIQFTNMIAPFPNLPVLQPNLQLFRENGVTAVFEQGCHGTYSENQELRQYLLAKLLWNPGLDTDSLKRQFMEGYFGAAAGYIDRYLGLMEQSLQQSGELLWIYSSPMQETNSFLTPENLREFSKLFDLAERSVASDSLLLSRVQKARLPLLYAILEIRKRIITGPDGFLELSGNKLVVSRKIEGELDTFVNQANRFGVKTIHEKGQTPDAYRAVTMNFFLNAFHEHLATGKSCHLSVQPAPKYTAEGPGTLTDGKRGSPNYFVLWQGFEGTDLEAVVDLGTVMEFNYAGAEFLQDLASWIFFPKKLMVAVSQDNLTFRNVSVMDSLSVSDPVLIREAGNEFPTVKARYVKFEITGEKICPAWHIGHGGKSWFFVDEFIVEKR